MLGKSPQPWITLAWFRMGHCHGPGYHQEAIWLECIENDSQSYAENVWSSYFPTSVWARNAQPNHPYGSAITLRHVKDEYLCPVRLTKEYIVKTKDREKWRDKPFLTRKMGPKVAVSNATIFSWLRDSDPNQHQGFRRINQGSYSMLCHQPVELNQDSNESRWMLQQWPQIIHPKLISAQGRRICVPSICDISPGQKGRITEGPELLRTPQLNAIDLSWTKLRTNSLSQNMYFSHLEGNVIAIVS